MGKYRAQFAYFPGTGPAGATCASCAHVQAVIFAKGRARFSCDLVRNMLNNANSARDIPGNTPACKYWQKREG